MSGLISGAINKIITHPFDTIKAKIQIQTIQYVSINNIKQKGILSTVKSVWKHEGIRGFFRGVNVAWMMGAPATCLFFGFYEIFRDQLKRRGILDNKLAISFFSGFFAECCSCVMWVPIDVIKERL